VTPSRGRVGGVLTVCVNGARRRHDRVPIGPAEVAASVVDAVAAGADAVHVHPRDELGAQTLDADLLAGTLAAVRAAVPGIPVGVSTHAGIEPDPGRRLEATELARTLRLRRVGVEAGLWTPAAAAAFVGTRWPWQVLRVLVEAIPGYSPGAEGPWSAGRILAALGRQPAPVLVHGEEHWTWPVLRWAQRQGFDTRVGLEDTLLDERGRRVETNAELVRAARPEGG
jgi:uncharacterized protein (DUF849 family)